MHYTISVGDNIELGLLRESDLNDLVQAINDYEISANTLNIPFPYGIDDARRFLEHTKNQRLEAGFPVNWSIKIEGRVQGGIGMLCNDGYDSHRTEIGFWIATAFHNKGIMTNVIGKFVKYIFDQMLFTRLQANTLCENIASQRTLEKNGFLREGLLRKYYKTQNEYVDVYCYSKLHPDIAD